MIDFKEPILLWDTVEKKYANGLLFFTFFQGDGEFKGLEGISVNSKGNILVADRENHRVQIF